MNHVWVRRSNPLLSRRGGRDTKKNAAKPPLLERTGWSLTRQTLKCVLEVWFASDHPVCAASVPSRHFITGTATPPLEEGNSELAKRVQSHHTFHRRYSRKDSTWI